MRFSIKDIILGTLKTSILLVILEIVSSAFFPAIGLANFRPPFSVIIVLYIAFKINDNSLPYIVLFLQNIHSVFSIEGWAISTLIGLTVALIVKYFKDLLDFSTAISTIFVAQVSQLIWFLLLALLLSIKSSDFSNFLTIFFQFIPESILLSLISPYFFMLMDRLWFSRSVSARV